MTPAATAAFVRRRAVILAAMLLSCCSSTPSTSPPDSKPSSARADQPPTSPMPMVVARVNGRDIPFNHLRILVEKRVRADGGKTTNRERIYRQALEELVRREILLQEAIARGIHAEERLVEKAYDEKRASQSNETAWREALSREGMTFESFKAEIRARLTIRALLAEVAAQVPADSVSAAEIRAFYEQNQSLFETGERRELSHIFIRVPPGVDAVRKRALRQRLEDLRLRIAEGEDFAALARAHSEDPTSRDGGGRLPPIAKGLMDEPFEKAAFALEPGQVSSIVETRHGFHLIKGHGVLPSRRLTFTEVRAEIRKRLLDRKRSEATSSFVESLRSRARIETYL